MSLIVTQRPRIPATSLAVINGTITGSLAPWVNFGTGTAWTYGSNLATINISSGDSRSFRQPFNAASGVTYNYSFKVVVSSAGTFSIAMSFVSEDGTVQSIRSVAAVNGTNTYSGSVVANANHKWVRVRVTEDVP